MIQRLLAGAVLCAGALSANSIYSIPAGATDKDGALSGYATFYLSNCVTSPVTTCTLNIAITNTQANPTAAGQLISGLSFDLENNGVTLSGTGILSDAINNNSNGNGSGGAVTVLNENMTTTTTTATPGRWDFGTVAQMGQGVAGFDLTTLTGGQPEYLMIASQYSSNLNSSITGHSPTLVGTVDFQITGLQGLSQSTVLSSVYFFMGTQPDAQIAGVCTSGCGGVIQTTTSSQGAVPEPFSLLLTGSALAALGMVRRRQPLA